MKIPQCYVSRTIPVLLMHNSVLVYRILTSETLARFPKKMTTVCHHTAVRFWFHIHSNNLAKGRNYKVKETLMPTALKSQIMHGNITCKQCNAAIIVIFLKNLK
jgi:hypothetical protein